MRVTKKFEKEAQRPPRLRAREENDACTLVPPRVCVAEKTAMARRSVRGRNSRLRSPPEPTAAQREEAEHGKEPSRAETRKRQRGKPCDRRRSYASPMEDDKKLKTLEVGAQKVRSQPANVRSQICVRIPER
jgi:hypothetical protein